MARWRSGRALFPHGVGRGKTRVSFFLRRRVAAARRRDIIGIHLRWWPWRPVGSPSWSHRLVASLQPAERRQLVLALLTQRRDNVWLEFALRDHPCGWSADDVDRLFEVTLVKVDPVRPRDVSHAACGLPLAALTELRTSGRDGSDRFTDRLRVLLAASLSDAVTDSYRCLFSLEELTALLPDEGDREVPGRVAALFPQDRNRGEFWPGSHFWWTMGTLLFEPGVLDLLVLCGQADLLRPSNVWLGRAREHLDRTPAAPDALRALLPWQAPDEESTLCARLFTGACWAACLTGDPELVGLLESVVLRHSAGMSLRPMPYVYHLPARGALAALSATAGEPGVGAQRRALPGLPPQAARAADEVLDKIADAELPPLMPFETLRIGRGEYAVSMKVRPDGVAVLEFRDAKGRVLAGVPRQLSEERPAAFAALRRRLLTVRARADRERGELAEMFATGTKLTGRQWYGRWLDSPTTAPMTGALIWELRSPSGTATGLPVRTPAGAWLLRGVRGTAHEVGPEDTVRLWQPSLADRAEVSAWRARLRRHKVRQPIPQLPSGSPLR